MSLFEFTFGLSAVILGLALAHMASTLSRLALAGRRVRWAVEPVLLSAIVVLITVAVWLNQWGVRNQTETTYGLMLIQVGKMIAPFMAASFVLPDSIPEEGPVDLYVHYDRTRALTFGALMFGLWAFWVHFAILWGSGRIPEQGPMTVWAAVTSVPWEYSLIYGALIVIRRRWINVVLLSAGLLWYGWNLVPLPLTG